MRDGKGIRNSKFEMRPAFAGHAHAWNLEIGRKCSRKGRKGREGRFDIMQNVEMLRLGS